MIGAVTFGPRTVRRLGEVGVDSGELIIIDPEWIDGPIPQVLDPEVVATRKVEGAVTFSPGLGDGWYEVIAHEREVFYDGKSFGKRVTKVEIICVDENQKS